MEAKDYLNLINYCLGIREFMSEFPNNLPFDPWLIRQSYPSINIDIDGSKKRKLRKFKSNMAKVLSILLELEQAKTNNATILMINILPWLFLDQNVYTNLEHTKSWKYFKIVFCSLKGMPAHKYDQESYLKHIKHFENNILAFNKILDSPKDKHLSLVMHMTLSSMI